MQKFVVFLVCSFCLVFFVPDTAVAAGLVPCGGIGQSSCQTCDVVKLTNNVFQWLVIVLGTFAAIIIIYAGVKLVTSGGNQSAMESAKSMITNVIIGYVIILAAWLAIDFGMKTLIDEGSFGVWNEVQCSTTEVPTNKGQTTIDFANPISSGTVDGAVVRNDCVALPNGSFNCNSQEQSCTTGGGTPLIDKTTTPWKVACAYPPPSGGGGGGGGFNGGSCSVLTSGPCSVERLRPYFGSRAEDASQICNKESGGAPVESRSDICCGPGGNCNSGSPSFSGGYFQVNILAHANLIPGCNLSSFFTRNGSTAQGNCVKRNARGICTGWSCTIERNSAYNQCMQGARNSTINLQIAKKLFDSRGFQPWTNSRNLCSVPN